MRLVRLTGEVGVAGDAGDETRPPASPGSPVLRVRLPLSNCESESHPLAQLQPNLPRPAEAKQRTRLQASHIAPAALNKQHSTSAAIAAVLLCLALALSGQTIMPPNLHFSLEKTDRDRLR